MYGRYPYGSRPYSSLWLAAAAGGSSGNLTQAAGTGVAGTIGSSVATGAIPQAAGIGVAGSPVPTDASSLTGVAGIGVAGALTPLVAVTLNGAVGTGTAGQFTFGAIGSLTQAAGAGVAGTITTSATASPTLGQAAGTGIAGAFTPSVSVSFGQGVGIGVAQAVSPAVSALLAQASGIGTTGSITPQVTGGTVSKTLPAAVGIGVAGVITAFSSTAVVVAPGGNGGVKNKKGKPVNFMPVERKGVPKPKAKVEAKAVSPKRKPKPELDTTLVPNDPAPPSLDPVVAPAAPRKLEDLSRFGITAELPSDLTDYAMAERLMAQLEHDEQPIRDTIMATIAAIKADIESDLIGA